MSNPGKPTLKPASPTTLGPASERSRTLKRRISSSFNTFLAALPIRRSSPHISSNLRSSTALGEGVVVRRVVAGANPQAIQHPPVIRLQVPSLSEPSQPCPYDASKYHSFPSLERARCTFCGMRPARSPSSEPCSECRSKSALSHIKSAFRRKPDVKAKEETTFRSPLPLQHSPSSEEGPRIVPPKVAAKRIGNPPRTAAVPVPRPGAINTSLERRNNTRGADVSRRSKSALERDNVRPISPKLHYHRGLPNSKDYPYVRESEVSQHLDAIRAGAPSPLIDFARAARRKKASNRTTDFSETVFYGHKFSAVFTNSAEQRRLAQPPRSNLVVEGCLETGGHVVVERPHPEQQASIDAQLYHSNVYPRRSQEQSQRQPRASRRSANSRNRMRRGNSDHDPDTNDQLPDFQEGPIYDEMPRLRGGSGGYGHSHTSGCGLAMKQLLLTCHKPAHGYDADSNSDNGLPPARTPNPTEVARALRRTHGTSRLPKGISRAGGGQETPRTGRSASGGEDITNLPTSRTASFAATYPQSCSLFSYLPSFSLISIFPRPGRPAADGPTTAAARIIQPTTLLPTASLRAGAGSPSALRDYERVPPTLFWLAGGKGKSIRTSSWKSHKPKKRMGGLLGMALHGLDAGTEYGSRKSPSDNSPGTEFPRNVPAAAAVSKPPVKEVAESVKSNKTLSSTSSSLSHISMKSHKSHSSKSNQSTAAGGEASREASLDPVPEEAAAPGEEAPPAGDAAAEGLPVKLPAAEAPTAEDAQREPVEAGAQRDESVPGANENVEQAAAEANGDANNDADR
jgi:hypothetical protein